MYFKFDVNELNITGKCFVRTLKWNYDALIKYWHVLEMYCERITKRPDAVAHIDSRGIEMHWKHILKVLKIARGWCQGVQMWTCEGVRIWECKTVEMWECAILRMSKCKIVRIWRFKKYSISELARRKRVVVVSLHYHCIVFTQKDSKLQKMHINLTYKC